MRVRTLALTSTFTDAVPDRVEMYKRQRFVPHNTHSRFTLRGTGTPSSDARIVPMASLELAALARLDSTWFGAYRRGALLGLLHCPGATALVNVDASGSVAGYGVLLPRIGGFKIAPLFAVSEHVADALLAALLGAVGEGEPVNIDVVVTLPAQQQWIGKHGGQFVCSCIRTYVDGVQPAGQRMDVVFGLTSFEFG